MIRRVLSGLSGFGFRQADDDDRQVVPFEELERRERLVASYEHDDRVLRLQERLSERERLMRHTGRRECPIPEHQDALQQLGKAIFERDQARRLAKHRFELMIILEAKVADLTEQVARANSRLNHPARGQEGSTPPPDTRPPPPGHDPDRWRSRGQEAA